MGNVFSKWFINSILFSLERKMAKVTIDANLCIGCGSCASICPACFEMKGDKAITKKEICEESCLQDAVDSCPTRAILVK